MATNQQKANPVCKMTTPEKGKLWLQTANRAQSIVDKTKYDTECAVDCILDA